MKKISLSVFLVLGGLTTVSYAQSEVVTEIPSPTYRSSVTSEDWRLEKEYSLLIEPVGFTPLLGYGAAAGYYVSPNDLVELSYNQGKLSAVVVTVSSQLAELRWKHWFGNSFYGYGGVAYRKLRGDVDLDAAFGSGIISGSIEAASLGVSGAIGNQWQFEYFTIGCDWIGVTVPVKKLQTNYHDFLLAEGEDRRAAERIMDRMAFQPTPQFLRVYIGAAF
jgi:hypothetical protein